MRFETEAMKKKTAEATKQIIRVVQEPEPTAKDLKRDLGGTVEERKREQRSIILTMKHGERPDVLFTGFWNGHLVKNAMNAISRGYRQRKHKHIRAQATVPQSGR